MPAGAQLMSASVEVKVDFSDFDDLLGAMAKVDAEPTMQVAAEMLVAGVSDRWQSGGDGEWPPHAPSTIASMGPHELMLWSGIAAGSVAADFGPDFAEAFSPVEYLQYHLEGGAKIPKRNPFELTDVVLEPIKAFIIENMGQRLTAAAADGGGRTVHTGARGGRFYYTASGRKQYVKR